MNFFGISLVVLYSALLSFVILKSKFFTRFSLSAKWIAGIFILKVITGVIYGLIHYYLYGGGDTFGLFNESNIVFRRLHDDPVAYLKLVFGMNTYPIDPRIKVFAMKMEFWDDPGSYFIVRMHALMRLVSFNCYYVHVVLYNFFTLIGILYLYDFFVANLPEKKYWLMGLFFIFPSVAFWSSGIHKDGISLAAMGLMLFFSKNIIAIVITRKMGTFRLIKNIFCFLLGCWLLLIIRNYLFLLLLPCLVAYLYTTHFPKYSLLKFTALLFVFYAVVFNLQHINSSWNILQMLSQQQEQSARIRMANTIIPINQLQPTVASLLQNAPQAISHCVIHPTFFEITSAIQLSSALDNFLLLLLVIALLFFHRKKMSDRWALLLLCTFFSISVFIISGETVPMLGALVRYKMPGVLFLVVGIFCLLDFEKMLQALKKLKRTSA